MASKKCASSFECGNCGQGESEACSMFVCGECRQVRYCSKACQSAHWKKGGHKTSCRKPACKPDFTEPRPEGDKCSICLDLLSASSTRSLACGHVLHSDCMTSLDKCPICRNPNVNCVLCFEPIGSDIFAIDRLCEHKMHAMCFSGFHFQSFLGASLDLICPISGCDAAVRPDSDEFKVIRVHSMLDLCAKKDQNSDKYLLWLFLNTYDGEKTSPEDRVKCEVYALRALRAATSDAVRVEAYYNYGLVVEDSHKAITAFQRSIALIPHVGAMVELLKRNSLGMHDMFRLVELRPTNLPILKAVADDISDYYGCDEPIVADFFECVLRRILDMDKTDGVVYARLGEVLSCKIEYSIEEAEGLLRTAISLYEMEPFRANPYYLLGRVLMLKPDSGAAALDMLVRGVEIDGDASELFDYWMIYDRAPMDEMERHFMKTPEYGDFLRYIKEDIPAAEAFELKHSSPAPMPPRLINLPRGVISLKLTPLAAAQELECLD